MGVLHMYIGKEITAVRPKVGELQEHCTQSSKYLDAELEQGLSCTLLAYTVLYIYQLHYNFLQTVQSI